MSRRTLNTNERQRVADDVVDLAVALSNALVVRSPSGLTLIELMSEASSAQIRAAAHDERSSSSTISDPTFRAATRHELDEPELAAALAVELDEQLLDVRSRLERATAIAARYLPRPARPHERELAELTQTNKDAGCESCARITTSTGARRYRATYVTGRVATKPDADKSKGKRRRMLLSAGDNHDRLAIDTRLCRPCYDDVKRRVMPGAQLSLAEAISVRRLRERIERERTLDTSTGTS
jgi:hypothetical protein